MASVARSFFNQSVQGYFDPIPDENFDLSWSDGLVVRGLTLRPRSVNQELARNGVDLRVSNGRVGELRLGYSACSGNVSMQLRDVDFSVKPNACRLVGKCVASSLYKCVTKPIACLDAMRARRLLAPPVPIYYYPDENNDYLVELPRSDPMHGGLGQFCCLGISSKKPRVPWKRRLPLKASTAASAIQLEPPGPYRQQLYWSNRPVPDCDDCGREVQSHFRYYHPDISAPPLPPSKADCPDLRRQLLPHHEAYIASGKSTNPEGFLLQPYSNEEFSSNHSPSAVGPTGGVPNGRKHNWRPSTFPPHVSPSSAGSDPRTCIQQTTGLRVPEVHRITPDYGQARKPPSLQRIPASQYAERLGHPPTALSRGEVYNRRPAPPDVTLIQQYAHVDGTTGINPSTQDPNREDGFIHYASYTSDSGVTTTAAPYSFSCQPHLRQQDFHNYSRLTVV